MHIIQTIKQSRDPLLIIAEYDHKTAILHAMHEAGLFHPVQFLSKKDLFAKVFFSLKPTAVYDASRHFNVKPAIIEAMTPYLHRVDEQTNYESAHLNKVRDLKRFFTDNDLLMVNPFGEATFRGKRIIVYGPVYDIMSEEALEKLTQTHEIEHFPLPSSASVTRTYCVHSTLEDEIRDLAIRIRKDYEAQGTFKHIHLLNAPTEAMTLIKTIFSRYAIPYNIQDVKSLEAYPLAQSLKRYVAEAPTNDFSEALRNALKSFKQSLRSSTDARVYQTLLKTLNPLITGGYDKTTGMEALTHSLSTSALGTAKYKDAVNIGPITALPANADAHVYVMGMVEGNAPAYAQEHDYLNKAEKRIIGMPTAKHVNRLWRPLYTDALKGYARLHYSSHDLSPSGEASQAHILGEITTTLRPEATPPENVDDQPYSVQDDMLNIKASKDALVAYGTVDGRFEKYGGKYTKHFDTYTNAFGPLESSTVATLNARKLSVSVTQIERYFQCGLHFLLEDVLNIRPIDSHFHMDMGNLFHTVLECDIDKETLSDEWLNERLDGVVHPRKPYSGRARVFFENAFDYVRLAHKHVREQERRSGFTVCDRERRLEASFTQSGPSFKGVIDKVLAYEDSVALVDYKSGSTTLDVSRAVHGISGQLLFYLLLYKRHVPEASISGFFEQKLLPKLSDLNASASKTKEEILASFYRLEGFVKDDPALVEILNPSFEDASFIVGATLKKDGTFSSNSKTFSEEGLNEVLDRLEHKLTEALEDIYEGHFPINPKRIEGREVSCTYCPFEDVCYKQHKDFTHLRGEPIKKQLKTKGRDHHGN